jgi:hypothetical protein
MPKIVLSSCLILLAMKISKANDIGSGQSKKKSFSFIFLSTLFYRRGTLEKLRVALGMECSRLAACFTGLITA